MLGNAGQVNYSSSKAAVTGLTRERYAVTVNWMTTGRLGIF